MRTQVLEVGALRLVAPNERCAVSEPQRHDLAAAVIWAKHGFMGQAKDAIRDVENELGTTPADRRYAKQVALGQTIVPGKAEGKVWAGGKALFVDEGRAERVLVTSEVTPHPESGEPMRTCSFIDQMGDEFDVKAACLAPCDDLWRPIPLAPEVLETGKWAGVPREAEPFRQRPVSKAPVMDKFDRVAPVKPEDVRLDVSRMKPDQIDRLRKAEGKLALADARKAERMTTVGGRIRYGRMTQAEKDERLYAKEAIEQLQRETLAANDKVEVSRGTVETLALAQVRGEHYVRSGEHLTRRNGLDTLLMGGVITHSEHAAGEKYAEIFAEAKAGELRIAAWNPAGGGSSCDPDTERQRRLRELEAKAKLTDLHGHVQAHVRSSLAVKVLKLTAGEGRHVSHIANGGGSRWLHTQALKQSLAVLADKWGLQ